MTCIACNNRSVVAENYSRSSKGNPQLPTADCICLSRPHGQDWHHRYPNIPGLIHHSLVRLMSDSSFPANPSYVRPSAKWDASTLSVSCPPTSTGSQFAQRNTTIFDPSTSRVPRWCTTYRSGWVSTILRWRVWGALNACGPLQRAATPANYEPDHLGGTSRHTRKPTGKLAV